MFFPSLYKTLTTDVMTILDGTTFITYDLGYTPDTTKTILTHLGSWNSDPTHEMQHHNAYISRVGNIITAIRVGTVGALTVGFCCRELYGGFILSIQDCTVTLNGVTSNTAAVSAVGSKAEIAYRGTSTNNTTGAGGETNGLLRKTSSTVVTAYKGIGTGILTVAGDIIDFR